MKKNKFNRAKRPEINIFNKHYNQHKYKISSSSGG